MLLRRITEHVKAQNWFAVGLDFVIVVVGVLIAFQITNWDSNRRAHANLVRAEQALQADLRMNYLNAKGRVTLSECRTSKLRELAQRLLEPGEDWEGIAHHNLESGEIYAIGGVLHSPKRQWGSRLWSAELSRGTFDQMDPGRRNLFDAMFKQTNNAEQLQDKILALQARLKVLGQTTIMSRTDRLRYFDIVSEIDEYSYFLERLGKQISDSIEEIGIVVYENELKEIEAYLHALNLEREAIYGACVKPITLPQIELRAMP